MDIHVKKAGRQARDEFPKWADNSYTIVLPDPQRENLKFNELQTLAELIKFTLGEQLNKCVEYEQIGKIVEHTTICSPTTITGGPFKKSIQTLTHYLVDDYGTCLIDKKLTARESETKTSFKLKAHDSLDQKTLMNLYRILLLILNETQIYETRGETL